MAPTVDQRPAWTTRACSTILAFAAAAFAAGCASSITAEQLRSRIESGTPPTILDVRSQAEFDAGHIPGALHFSFWKLATELDELPEEAATGPVVLHCEHGPRAWLARAQLWFAETGEVFYLEGHMAEWKAAGHPVYERRAP